MQASGEIDTGDVVIHWPSRESWVVACVEGERLSWCGWPEGMAKLSDCKLKKKATPEKRMEILKRLASMGGNDHRQRYAARILAEATNGER